MSLHAAADGGMSVPCDGPRRSLTMVPASRRSRLDLAIVFASPPIAREIAPRLASVPAATVIGCSGSGIIGDAREIEDRPAVSVTAAELPGVTCTAFRVEPDGLPPDATAWRAPIGAE